MTQVRQVIFGVVAAILSIIIIFGSLSLALTEGNLRVAYVTTTLSAALPTIFFTPTSALESNIPAAITATASPTLVESSTLTPTPLPTRCPVPSGWSKITVKNGDTLASLAETYQTTPAALAKANCLLTDSLIPGTELSVPGISPTQPPTPCGPPPGWIFYTVQKGDNLFRISQAYGITVNELMFANCLVSDLIRVGQNLYVPNVPTLTPTPSPRPKLTRTPTPTAPATPTDTVEVPTETYTISPTPSEIPGTPYP